MITDPAERNERVMTLAAEMLKTSIEEREKFLKSACQEDLDLYQEVSEVVAWEERMRGFLDRPLIEFIDLEVLERVFEPGQTVSGRFEIRRCVGDGGMGVVYEAFDTKRNQRIALKVAKPGLGRLLSPELEGALKVRHTNICRVNEIHAAATEFGDLDFLTMEFLDGEPLSHRLAQGRPDKDEAFDIARQLCAGVIAAHQSGVLHRDLKPGNIILCREEDGSTRVVITDFGLSTDSSVVEAITGGTPSYMAPELWQGSKASQASDVFSLGVILYEVVTGQKPFPAGTKEYQDIYPPAAPSKLVRNLSHRWDRAILPCLRPEPEKRWSAEQILEILERKPFYRKPALVVAIAACLLLTVLLIPSAVSFFEPSPIRLALLPADGSSALTQRGNAILDEVTQQVKKIQAGKPTVSVIPVSMVLSKGVKSPQDAQNLLGATHVLQLKLRPARDGVAVEGTLFDLQTMAHIQNYSAHFAETDLSDVSTGLTGLISGTLHIHRTAPQETIAPAALTAYKDGRAYLYREPHDFTDAINEFEKAARLDPHSPLPAAGLAEAYTRKYQVHREDEDARKDAQFWLARAEALDADSPTVRMASGLLHLIQGNNPKALDDYRRVEEIDPSNVEALLGSGFAYESQGLLDKALKDYRQAISLSPNYYKPHEYLGALYYYHGQYAEAEEPYKKDIECAPDRVNAYGSLAGVYTAQFKYAQAENVYRALLQRKETALTLNNIGVMLAFQERQKEAIEYYRQAVSMEPSRAIYWLNLGDSQRRIKDTVSAKQSYQRGLQLVQAQVTANPGNAAARAYLAYFDAQLGSKAPARSEIAAALNSPAKDDQVVLCAVLTYESLGDRDRALAAAAMATPQTQEEMSHHPDLAGLQQDSRFKSLRGPNSVKGD